MDKVRIAKKREFYRTAIAVDDLNAAWEFSIALLEHRRRFPTPPNLSSTKDEWSEWHFQGNAYWGMLYGLVICYSRPFTANKPYGALSISSANSGYYTNRDFIKKPELPGIRDLSKIVRDKLIRASNSLFHELYDRAPKRPEPYRINCDDDS